MSDVAKDDAHPRVRLRPLRREDLDLLFAWEQHPPAVAMAAFTAADPSDRAPFDAHYRRIMTDPEVTLLAIEVDGSLAGSIGSFTTDGRRELTYWVDPEQWGRGIATRAVRLLLDMEPTRPIFARVAAHNLASRTVLERAGFRRVGEEVSWADGVGRDVLEYLYRLDGEAIEAADR